MKKYFFKGIKDGLPICLGYLAVSFGVGIAAAKAMPAWVAVVMSVTNLTSAGEVAGINIIAECGGYFEMVLTQLLINIRYSLMALSLSQNLSTDFGTARRMICAYGITDEIFGVCAASEEPVVPEYMYGMILVAGGGWTLGTALGAVIGNILPDILLGALSILIYGMFIAIIIPPVRKSRSILYVILISAAVSCLLYFGVPAVFDGVTVSSGFSVIICAVIAAGIMAAVSPADVSGGEEER